MIPLSVLFLLAWLQDPHPDLPGLADLDRFPAVNAAMEQLRLYRAHQAAIEERLPYWRERAEEAEHWHEQTRECVRLWDVLTDAQMTHADMRWRREKLAWLRRLLGEEAYRQGHMPPAIDSDVYPR